MLAQELPDIDIVVCTALFGKEAPESLPESLIKCLKPGSVIVDLAAERGGNSWITKQANLNNPAIVKDASAPGKSTYKGIINLAYKNWPSRMPTQASEFWANNMFNLFSEFKTKDKEKEKNKGYGEKDSTIGEIWNVNTRTSQIINPMTVMLNGKWHKDRKAPPPVKRDEKKKAVAVEEIPVPPYLYSLFVAFPVLIIAVLIGLATQNDQELLFNVFVFTLACIIGFMVIWDVTPALHTPLMSVTNAISGIIVIGCMLQLTSTPFFVNYSACGFIGCFFASINIFGGFVVTQKMINMFVADKGAKEEKKGHH